MKDDGTGGREHVTGECRRIESLLPPYVDGDAAPDGVAAVEAHLAGCDDCRRQVAAERTARLVLRARAPHLATAAPPGLRTRIAAGLDAGPRVSLGWRGRVAAFAAAAAILLGVTAALELVTPRSNVLFAAQLAIDHVRCFVIEWRSSDPADPRELQRGYADRHGWTVPVPPSDRATGLTLVAARRCPFSLGEHAHLLYRSGERQVSLYVTQDQERPADALHLLGHAQRIWTSGGDTYVLVARGVTPAELDGFTDYLRRQTDRQ